MPLRPRRTSQSLCKVAAPPSQVSGHVGSTHPPTAPVAAAEPVDGDLGFGGGGGGMKNFLKKLHIGEGSGDGGSLPPPPPSRKGGSGGGGGGGIHHHYPQHEQRQQPSSVSSWLDNVPTRPPPPPPIPVEAERPPSVSSVGAGVGDRSARQQSGSVERRQSKEEERRRSQEAEMRPEEDRRRLTSWRSLVASGVAWSEGNDVRGDV
jgi:hypothetical protein